MTEFENENKAINSLPSIEDIEYHPLQKSYLTVSVLASLIFYCIPIIAICILLFIGQNEVPNLVMYIGIALVIILFIISLVSKILGFPHKLYGLRTQDIIYKSGLIWRNETIVPFNRIQHVEITQGPLERKFGISKLKVFTAGGSQSDLVIPGLIDQEANRIKSFLIEKIKTYV